MNNLYLDLHGQQVQITITLTYPSHATAGASYNELSQQFRRIGAVVLTCGELEVMFDVTPRPPGQKISEEEAGG